tara:strand:+ start:934 stop:1437 length:504 start_codon:yes stop_codon:yes gene_type:complete
MKILNKLTLLIFVSLLSCSIYGQKQEKIKIGENQIGMIFTSDERSVVGPGTYDANSKILVFDTYDSVVFEIPGMIDVNVQVVKCRVELKYFLSQKDLEKIGDRLEWVHSIEGYKELILEPEIRDVIRKQMITLDYNDEDLIEIISEEVTEIISTIVKVDVLEIVIRG